MDVIGVVLSVLAIALTVAGYFMHDKRLKEQEEKLNAYQLRKIDEEEHESKKALVKGNIIKYDKGKRELRVFNSGRSAARNVRVEYLNDMEHIAIRDDNFPYELLNPQDHSEILLMPVGPVQKLHIKFIWDDDFKNNNELVQVLTL
jgi:hypothetical protein